MSRCRTIVAVLLPGLILLTFAGSSWAWVRVGFRGPRVGVYVAPGPWWGYDYDEYPPEEAYYEAPQTTSISANSHQNLEYLNRQIARARDQVAFEYQDGDISQADYEAELKRLYDIKKEAHAEAKANGGYLTGHEENQWLQLLRNGGEVTTSLAPQTAPSQDSDRSLKKVTDEIQRLRALLNKKLADGDITRTQYSGLLGYLNQTEAHVQSDASSNGGSLMPDQESAVLLQLQRVSDSLSKNLIAQ